MPHRPDKIISGGQTGVDRAALDLAIENGIAYGGYIPLGRWAEDGTVSDKYKGLIETETSEPAERTKLNIVHSDATLIISRGKLKGGSMLTWRIARAQRRPLLHIDLDRYNIEEAVAKTLVWLEAARCTTLNVAGPRESKDPGIYDDALTFLRRVFKP